MMMRFVAVGVAAAFLSTSAWAMPAAAPAAAPAVAQDSIVLAQYKKDYPKKGASHAKRGHKHHFKPGHKYKKAPKGWRRHGKRPSDWQRRGCIIVGPVWFCP